MCAEHYTIYNVPCQCNLWLEVNQSGQFRPLQGWSPVLLDIITTQLDQDDPQKVKELLTQFSWQESWLFLWLSASKLFTLTDNEVTSPRETCQPHTEWSAGSANNNKFLWKYIMSSGSGFCLLVALFISEASVLGGKSILKNTCACMESVLKEHVN